MSQSGVKSEDQKKRLVPLKRKRPTPDEEDVENIMPPAKILNRLGGGAEAAAPRRVSPIVVSPREVSPRRVSPRGVSPKEASPRGTSPKEVSNRGSPRGRSPRRESLSQDEVADVPSVPSVSRMEGDDATVSDGTYSDDNLFSPQYNVLSPLENVLRIESNTLKRKHSKGSCPGTVKRKCPLPALSWADAEEVWNGMCERDARAAARRSHHLFRFHPNLQLRMRAILLDWLNEVCEVYKMYRETFHLTVNYIDRYLSSTEDVHKGRLQLIGITCLFIAAKVEEVYPPKIGEFAYVTDGACTSEDILAEEMAILAELDWQTTPATVNGWLGAYMQLHALHAAATPTSAPRDLRPYTFVFPQYSSLEYAVCGQLVDLAVLHVGVNAFPSGLLAAAAVAHVYDRNVAQRVSGYAWEELAPCYSWLAPFAEVLGGGRVGVPDCGADFVASGGGLARICPDINLDQSHRIQVHNVCLDLFDKVQECMATTKVQRVDSTPTTSGVQPSATAPATPPLSGQKSGSEEVATPAPTRP